MKIATLFAAAGLVVAAMGVGTAADARDWNQNGRPDRYDRVSHGRGWSGHDRRWNRHHPVRCHTEWRHHQRVRICR